MTTNKQLRELAKKAESGHWFSDDSLHYFYVRNDADSYLDAIYMNDLSIHMSQKEFAASAIKHPTSFLLFSARKNGRTPRKEFFALPIDKQVAVVVKWYQDEKGED